MRQGIITKIVLFAILTMAIEGQNLEAIASPNLAVSYSEIPTVENSKEAIEMISTLDKNDDWVLGKIEGLKKGVNKDDAYLSLNYYLPVESNNYRISVKDKTYRVIINQFNQNNQNIGYVDLCSGDILSIDDSARYITVSIYQYKNRKVLTNNNQNMLKQLKKGLIFTVDEIIEEVNNEKVEELTAEVHSESLTNYNNYRTGWFKSWGGTYEFKEGSICTGNLYKVDNKPYIINVNDSRITLTITEYDKNGKWLKYNEAMSNGDKFNKQKSTSYIGITIRSKKWGVDLATLFKSGLQIDLSSKLYMDKTETIDIKNSNFSSLDHWKSGGYLPDTGEYIIDPNKICYEAFCKVGSEDYIPCLPGGYLKMSILELTKDGKVVKVSELQGGRRWKKSKQTEKVAITIYNNENMFGLDDYKNFIKNYQAFGLQKYVKYTHNTRMRDITAGEFINTVNVGWNLGNSLDSKSKERSKTANLGQELNWGNPYISKDLIDYVAKSGFNTIRIPVTWYYNTYQDKNGTLKINQEWLSRVQDVVDYAIANNLYVILNTHHEQPVIYTGTDDKTMVKVKDNATALWNEIAEYFKTYDEHLIFEAYNEVDNIERSWNYSDKAAQQMNELNQVFVNTVRGTGGNNVSRILIVPTLLDGASSKFYEGFLMPRDTATNKLVVQVHIYTKKFNQDIESDFLELSEFSKKIKAPIIIGEFGTTPNYPLPGLREEQASNYVARAAEYGIKCILWDNGSDYKVIDRKDFKKSDQEMITALLEGSQGVGYQLKQGMEFHSIEQFVNRMPNVRTGELENKYWGTLTTDLNGSAVPVQESSYFTISLKAKNKASSIWIQRLLFYDANGKLIQTGKELQSRYYVGQIPENAVRIRVSINSPVVNMSLKEFQDYLSNGDLELVIRYFNTSDVKATKLTVAQYK